MNAFNHPWKFQVSYVFPPPVLIPLVSMFLPEYATSQFRLLILEVPYWMEAPWLPTAQLAGGHSLLVSHHKISHNGCFSRLHTHGSAIVAFNPLAVQGHMLHTRVLFLRLSGVCRGNLSIYKRSLPVVLEGMSRLVCSTGCTKQCHLPLILADL